jgi:hypothetical protein
MEMGKRHTSLKRKSPGVKEKMLPERNLREPRPTNETEDPEEEKDTWAFENPARERLRSTGIVQ